MQIKNNKNGFLSIVAAVTIVAVVGGGTLMGVAVVDNVAKSGCGDSLEKWRSGQAYADIAGNKEGAIEDAQRCQEAVVQATEVAKTNAALLGRASNISGSGVELISTEVVNVMMDYVEESAKSGYQPLEKNNRLPKDIVEEIKKEESEAAEVTYEDSFSEEQVTDKEEVKNEAQQMETGDSDCNIEVFSDGSPNVLASCEKGNMGFWYSDKNGDIVKSRARFRINIPDFGGYQEFEWEEVPYVPVGDPVCGFESADHGDQPSFFKGHETQLYVDIQLIDSTGKKSDISSCKIK